MLNSYRRRAFISLAIIALPSAAARASADDPVTLWDALTTSNASNTGSNSNGSGGQSGPLRRPLGAIPGFTLPSSDHVSSDDLPPGKRRKQYRGMFGSISRMWDQFEAATGTSIKASGSSTLSMRRESISGGDKAAQSYHNEQYYGQGSNGIYTDTNVQVDATLFKYFHYQTSYSNSPFKNPNENRAKLDYNTPKLRLEWGDINAGFQGNSLIDFNRYLSGVKLTNQWTPKLKTSMLYTKTKAETRTLTLTGQDSSGPYYVYAGQVVDGSVHIRIDNRDLAPTEYTLDTYTGQLNFKPGYIVLHSSTIAVSFETLGFNQNSGTIYGIRSEFAPRGSTKVGFTYVIQKTRTGAGLQLRTQEFYGKGDPTQPYVLDQAVDTTKLASMIVLLNGVPLVQGLDYVIDPHSSNQILIPRQPVPATSLITVRYFPLNDSVNAGDRSVLGFDGRIGLGKIGGLTLETAFSGLNVTGKSIAGQAVQVRADLTPFRNMHSILTVRDVNPTFSSIQSPGFNRNEKSIDLAGEYTPSRKVHFTYDVQKAQRPSYSAGATGQFSINSKCDDKYDQYSLGMAYNLAKHAVVNLSRTSLSTRYIVGGQSSNQSDTLSLAYTLRSLSLETAISRSNSSTDGAFNLYGSQTTALAGATTQNYNTKTETFSKRVGLNWTATKWMTLNGTLSDNDISNNGTSLKGKTNARDTQFGARFTPAKQLRINYSFDLTDTGNANNTTATTTTVPGTTTTATGISSGVVASRSSLFTPWSTPFVSTRDLVAGTVTSPPTTGNTLSANSFNTIGGGGSNSYLGSGGNYSGYLGGSNIYTTGSVTGRSTTHRFDVQYSPRSNMNIGFQFDTGASVGDYQYNSSRRNASINFGWQPSTKLQFNLLYSLQRVLYNNNFGGTNSNTLQFSMQGRPFGGKLNTQFSYQLLRNKSALQTTAAATTTTLAGGTAVPTNTSSDLHSFALRLDYPISSRQTVFIDLLNSNTLGYLGSSENDIRFGLDFGLTQALKFSLGWQIIDRRNQDPSLSSLNYHTSSLLAEFGLHF